MRLKQVAPSASAGNSPVSALGIAPTWHLFPDFKPVLRPILGNSLKQFLQERSQQTMSPLDSHILPTLRSLSLRMAYDCTVDSQVNFLGTVFSECQTYSIFLWGPGSPFQVRVQALGPTVDQLHGVSSFHEVDNWGQRRLGLIHLVQAPQGERGLPEATEGSSSGHQDLHPSRLSLVELCTLLQVSASRHLGPQTTRAWSGSRDWKMPFGVVGLLLRYGIWLPTRISWTS